MNYTYKLTEEIARWAFEVHLKNLDDWDIVFTNPTAGPWKRIEAFSNEKKRGEVYRFDKDEKRPDIVAVNDKLQCILIFEAKDTLNKLIKDKQIDKSIQVVIDMANKLKNIEGNEFWSFRNKYKIYNTLLWGSIEASKSADIKSAFELYEDGIRNGLGMSEMLAIESFKDGDKITLKYHLHGETEELSNIHQSLSM
jgi:hypothetical protein